MIKMKSKFNKQKTEDIAKIKSRFNQKALIF